MSAVDARAADWVKIAPVLLEQPTTDLPMTVTVISGQLDATFTTSAVTANDLAPQLWGGCPTAGPEDPHESTH